MLMEVSPTAMNHMASDVKLVHARLERWARWAKAAQIRAWPQTTLLGRVIAYGPDGALAKGSGLSEVPDDIAHVDGAVAKLGEVDRRVIRAYYLEWAPTHVLVCRLGMKNGKFRAVLNRARWRIIGYLSAVEKVENAFKWV